MFVGEKKSSLFWLACAHRQRLLFQFLIWKPSLYHLLESVMGKDYFAHGIFYSVIFLIAW